MPSNIVTVHDGSAAEQDVRLDCGPENATSDEDASHHVDDETDQNIA